MINIFLFSILIFSSQQERGLKSPDGNFSVAIEATEMPDSQSRYIMRLIDNHSGKVVEIARCVVKDLPSPNFYWSKDSQFLIFEQSNNSFDKAIIKVLRLKTLSIDIELPGLIGNTDFEKQQFDSENGIIFYFNSTNANKNEIPPLFLYELKSGITKRLLDFGSKFELEFPAIQRAAEKRELMVTYSDPVSGNHTEHITY